LMPTRYYNIGSGNAISILCLYGIKQPFALTN
jgi:hypothetical protein